MTKIARPQRKRRTCQLCGRQADTGQPSEIGWVGPECAQKVAALPKVLNVLGLDLITGGTLQAPAARDHLMPGGVAYGHPYDAARRRLERVGFTLERVGGIDWFNPRPVATFQVRVRRVRQAQKVLTQAQVQADFAARLLAGSAARAGAA